MTQIVVTLDDNTNISLIKAAINKLRGVRNVIVQKMEPSDSDLLVSSRLKIANQLAGSVIINEDDLKDDRTRYLMDK